jgi:peptidoglycan/LPS O-acetylase OafA/YrhL
MNMQHMPHPDSLRAFAISAVLVKHFVRNTLNAFIPVSAGTIGVNLFFTWSAFLITTILLDSVGRDTNGIEVVETSH